MENVLLELVQRFFVFSDEFLNLGKLGVELAVLINKNFLLLSILVFLFECGHAVDETAVGRGKAIADLLELDNLEPKDRFLLGFLICLQKFLEVVVHDLVGVTICVAVILHVVVVDLLVI